MKRVWWALPTTVLVCTGWLWSADAADLRFKKKAKPAGFRNAALQQTPDSTIAGARRVPESEPAADESTANEPQAEASADPYEATADEFLIKKPVRAARPIENAGEDSVIDRLLAENGLLDSGAPVSKAAVRRVSDAPAGVVVGKNSQANRRQRPTPTAMPAGAFEQLSAPEEELEPVTTPSFNPRRKASQLRNNARNFFKGSTRSPVGAAPIHSPAIPQREEVPAPGVEETAGPDAAAENVTPADFSADSDKANGIELTGNIQPPPQAVQASVPRKPAPAVARKPASPAYPVQQAVTPIATEEELTEDAEEPVPEAVPAPAPAPAAPVAPVVPATRSAVRGKPAHATPRTPVRPAARPVSSVTHRPTAQSSSDGGEFPALQPAVARQTDADGATLPPPPTRVRPVARKAAAAHRPVQQTSVSSSTPANQTRLIPAAATTATIATTTTTQIAAPQQTPSMNLRWVTDGEVNLGQPCKCGLVVKNSSNSDAHNILVEAAFPKTVRIVSAKPEPRLVQDNLVWKFNEFPAGEERTIEIIMIPFKRGDLATSASVRFTGTASTVMKVEGADPALTIQGPQEGSVGETITPVVSVSNPGSGAAQDVTVHALIPKGLEHPRGKRIELTLGSLAPGESRDVRLTLAAVAGGDHSLHVEARSGQHLVRKSDSVIHVTAPKVTIALQGPALRYAGRQAQYVATVSNVGTLATDNVRVAMQIAPGFEYVKADHGGRHDWNNRTVTWFVGRLEPNQTADFPVMLMARQAGTHQHTATVTDEVGGTATSVVETRVETTSAIVMEVADLNDPIEVGSQTAYDIRIRNDGSKAAQDVTLAFEVPAGVELVDTQGPTAARRGKGGVTFKALPSLAPKQHVTYRVFVTGREPGNLRFRAKLTTSASTDPLVVEELTKFYAD